MNIKIESERLYLRPINEDDDQDFFELDSNPRVHEFLGNNPVTSIEESRAYIKSILQQYKDYGVGRLAMIKKDTGEFIGWCGLKFEREVRKGFDYYDLGYRLKERFWGHGYATEAAIASLSYGFNDLNLKEICAAAYTRHKVSNIILKKIGLKPSGTFTYDNELCNWYTLKNPDL
ncbi:GNAT family N-acetyltransferase [Winogradskyella sp. J14-2]|uniref:GNAT family N-acetyltransferase n=1 Tax=Winogradskyella sp. J14-2 TaxID=1936080 RepID=UPI000972AC9F|nr:GNAT family N-acetyltransferase [Winogradskyella sp. J14-2]APY09286.1 GNAT family N-acetyltransferase [Winogradskyella sp. J14-2]